MQPAVLFYLLINIPSTVWSDCSTIYSVVESEHELPYPDNRFAVGYTSRDNNLFYVGGNAHPTTLVTFDIETETFTPHLRKYLHDGYISGSAPFWTQIGNTLWINKKGDFPVYDIYGNKTGETTVGDVGFLKVDTETYELTDPSIQFPWNHIYGGKGSDNRLSIAYTFGADSTCITSHEQYIFVVGGEGGAADPSDMSRVLNTIQVYDTLSGKWLDDTPRLAQKRYFATCVVADGVLWTMGGFDYAHQSLRSIETLLIGDMAGIGNAESRVIDATLPTEGHYGSRAVAYGDDIFVIGGSDGYNYLSDIIVIDTNTNELNVCGALQTAAMYMAPIIVDYRLFILGGYNDKKGFNMNVYQYIDLPKTSVLSDAVPFPSNLNGGVPGYVIAIVVISVVFVVAMGCIAFYFRNKNGKYNVDEMNDDLLVKDDVNDEANDYQKL